MAGTRGRPLAPAPVRVFDVTDYGAKGDGVNPDTAAVQAAIEATAGSGRRDRANSRRELPDLPDLPPLARHAPTRPRAPPCAAPTIPPTTALDPNNPDAKLVALVNGTDLVDVAITGQGAIDGHGQTVVGPAFERRPRTAGLDAPRSARASSASTAAGE